MKRNLSILNLLWIGRPQAVYPEHNMLLLAREVSTLMALIKMCRFIHSLKCLTGNAQLIAPQITVLV